MDFLFDYCWKNGLSLQPPEIYSQQPINPYQLFDAQAQASYAQWANTVIVGLQSGNPSSALVFPNVQHPHYMQLAPPPSALPLLFPSSIPALQSTSAQEQLLPTPQQHLLHPVTSHTQNSTVAAVDICVPSPNATSCASVDSGIASGGSSPSASGHIYFPGAQCCAGKGVVEKPAAVQTCSTTSQLGRKVLLLRSIDAGGRVTLPTTTSRLNNKHNQGLALKLETNAIVAADAATVGERIGDEVKQQGDDHAFSENEDPMPVLEIEKPLEDSRFFLLRKSEEVVQQPLEEKPLCLAAAPQPPASLAAQPEDSGKTGSAQRSVVEGENQSEERGKPHLVCLWGTCKKKLGSDNTLYDHVVKDHLELLRPLIAGATTSTDSSDCPTTRNHSPPAARSAGTRRRCRANEKFCCRWKGCKHVFRRTTSPSKQFDWLLTHYTTRHAIKAQPHKCLFAGCTLRFRLRSTLADHLNSAHDKKSGLGKRDGVKGPLLSEELRTLPPASCYLFRPCIQPIDYPKHDCVDLRTMEWVRYWLDKQCYPADEQIRDEVVRRHHGKSKSEKRGSSLLQPRASECRGHESGTSIPQLSTLEAHVHIRSIFKPPVLKREI